MYLLRKFLSFSVKASARLPFLSGFDTKHFFEKRFKTHGKTKSRPNTWFDTIMIIRVL